MCLHVSPMFICIHLMEGERHREQLTRKKKKIEFNNAVCDAMKRNKIDINEMKTNQNEIRIRVKYMIQWI